MRFLMLSLNVVLFAGCAAQTGTTPVESMPAETPSRSVVLQKRVDGLTRHDVAAREKSPEPEWKQKIQKKLHLKSSDPFQNMPPSRIIEALQSIYEVTIIVDNEIDVDTPIDLPLQNMTLQQGFDILVDKLDPDGNVGWSLKNGAIYIGDKSKFYEQSELTHYDVRDLIGELKDFRAPKLEVTQGAFAVEESSSETDEPITGDDLVELIQCTIAPDSWDEDHFRTISIRNGAIVVNHTAEVHDQIQELLAFMRKQRALQVRTEATFWKLTRREWLSLRDLNPDSEIMMNARQIDYLDVLRRNRKAVFDRVQTLGFNTQRMCGGTLDETAFASHKADDGNVVDRMARAGTLLDVRPIVAHDRQSVTNELRVTRARITGWETVEGPDGPVRRPQLKRQFFRGAISIPVAGVAVVSMSQDGDDVLLVTVTQELLN